MRILLAHDRLTARSGADSVARDLAIGLQGRGHSVTLYTPLPGDLGDEIAARGVPVVADPGLVTEAPEIVHGNHHVETMQALLRFPHARGIFVCHHRSAPMAAPPVIERVRRYVAVDDNCLERLTGDYAIPVGRTQVIYNAVDIDRFRQRDPLPDTPRRALVFSNYAASGTYLEAVRAACDQAGLPLDVIGAGAGTQSPTPELLLTQYDLVFAKARCALEAMAAGAAVILCDTHGLGPMVTSGRLDELRRWNFGMRVLSQPLHPSLIVEQMARYDATDARIVSDMIRARAHLSAALDQYVALYQAVMSEHDECPAGHELEEYLRGTATRIYALERELIDYRRPYRMEVLSESACDALRMRMVGCPETVECGGRFQVEVEVDNGSQETIASFVPFPVHLSYRWLGRNGAGDHPGMLVAEGPRTPLNPALQAGGRETYALLIEAPAIPGRHQLLVTLVQESVRWLDTLAVPVAADSYVELTAPKRSSSSPA